MPFNLLLVPLIGGFIFVSLCNRTRFQVARSDKDRLLFFSSIAGLASLILAYAIFLVSSTIIPCTPDSFCLSLWWKKNVPFEYSDVSFIALILNLCAIPIGNCIWKKDQVLDRLIREDGDGLEVLLAEAQDRNVTISITMVSGKVYVGFVTSSLNPGEDNTSRSISLLPLRSGYRDPITKQLYLPIDYAQALEGISQEIVELEETLRTLTEKLDAAREPVSKSSFANSKAETEESLENLKERSSLFKIAIRVSEISSVGFYDNEFHTKYFLTNL